MASGGINEIVAKFRLQQEEAVKAESERQRSIAREDRLRELHTAWSSVYEGDFRVNSAEFVQHVTDALQRLAVHLRERFIDYHLARYVKAPSIGLAIQADCNLILDAMFRTRESLESSVRSVSSVRALADGVIECHENLIQVAMHLAKSLPTTPLMNRTELAVVAYPTKVKPYKIYNDVRAGKIIGMDSSGKPMKTSQYRRKAHWRHADDAAHEGMLRRIREFWPEKIW